MSCLQSWTANTTTQREIKASTIMAKLSKTPHPMDWNKRSNETTDEYFARTGKQIETLQKKSAEAMDSCSAVGFLMQFPVADGYAYYVITSTTPLTLQHVPYGDAYQAAPAHLRGIRMSDVARAMASDKFMSQLMANKQ